MFDHDLFRNVDEITSPTMHHSFRPPSEFVSPVSSTAPVYTYKVVNVYPHDRDAFAQGLVFKKQKIFSTARTPILKQRSCFSEFKDHCSPFSKFRKGAFDIWFSNNLFSGHEITGRSRSGPGGAI
jgi:hypothetical protein